MIARRQPASDFIKSGDHVHPIISGTNTTVNMHVVISRIEEEFASSIMA
jgi:hypothetical protein